MEMQRKTKYPKYLQAGDQVCLIDPANAFTDEAVEEAIAFFEREGLRVVVSEDMAFKRGSAKERAKRFNRVIRDKRNRGIICVWGGYGSMPLLEYLDYEALQRNSPVFAGYSDNTALHLAIAKHTGLVTFHGPSVYSPTRPTTEEAKRQLLHRIMEKPQTEHLENINHEPFQILHPGEAEGILTGGNLTLISRLMGTPYEIDTKDKILFFEEIGEKPYRIHGMLTQLRLAGKLSQTKGIVVGELNNCDDQGRAGSGMDAVRDVLDGIDVPIIYNVRAGHVADSLTLPLNGRAKIRDGELEICV